MHHPEATFISVPKGKGAKIIEETGRDTGLKPAEITSDSRKAPIVWARQVCMWRMRVELGYSFPVIARTVGRGDHTTAMHGWRRMLEWIRELHPRRRALLIMVQDMTGFQIDRDEETRRWPDIRADALALAKLGLLAEIEPPASRSRDQVNLFTITDTGLAIVAAIEKGDRNDQAA